MAHKGRGQAVKSLTDVYTVVIGVAVSLGVTTVVGGGGLQAVSLSAVSLFLAFIATLLPFVHGALRHLDVVYFETAGPKQATGSKPGALVLDFVLLFFHALAFVVLARLLGAPADFSWILVIVLSIDIVWGIFANFSSRPNPSTTGLSAPARWAIINIVFVAGIAGFLTFNNIWIGSGGGSERIAVPILCGCIVRTLADYLWCRDFYFQM